MALLIGRDFQLSTLMAEVQKRSARDRIAASRSLKVCLITPGAHRGLADSALFHPRQAAAAAAAIGMTGIIPDA